MNLKQVLKQVDSELNQKQPSEMDELIKIVHSTPGIEKYGTHFTIVKYMGYLQGVRVYITGTKTSHCLPVVKNGKKQVYSVFKGLEKYISAGWQIETE